MKHSRVSLILGLLAMAAWLVGGFIVPVGSGWIHLALGAGIMLLVRAVVLWQPRATDAP